MKQAFQVFTILMTLVTLASCASSNKSKQSEPMLFTMKDAPFIGETFSNQKLFMGGFSGLHYQEKKGGAYYFQAITDRGPNGWSKGNEKPFLLPTFSPIIVTLKADPKTMELSVVSKIELKKMDGKPLSGLPNSRVEENPIDVFGILYSLDPMGLDSEGLVVDEENGFWVADEYAPSLVHFDSTGAMKRRLTPGSELPKLYSDRKLNRGFEGITKIGQKLFGFLQSPLPSEEFARIAEVDLDSMKTRAEYFYPFKKGNSKIGDVAAIDSQHILVIEQNGEVGLKSQKDIFKITLGESDQIVSKVFVASLDQTSFKDQEKVEGLAIIDEHTIAVTSDNDFQIAGLTDFKTGLTPLNDKMNQILILTLPKKLSEF